jgi:hypothetical protein
MRTAFLALERPKKQPPAAEASAWRAFGCCLAYATCTSGTRSRSLRSAVRMLHVRRSSAYEAPESPRVSRLRLVTENSALRGARRTLQLRHVVGTYIAPSATVRAKEYCHEARATRVGFGADVLPQVQQRKIHQVRVGSVNYPDNEAGSR